MPDPVTFARVFLGVSVAVFLVVYALPLALVPLRWARWFRWRLPHGDPDLTVYFGRCTGVLALAVIVAVLPAVRDPRAHLDRFELVAWATGLMPWSDANMELPCPIAAGRLAARRQNGKW